MRGRAAPGERRRNGFLGAATAAATEDGEWRKFFFLQIPLSAGPSAVQSLNVSATECQLRAIM